MIKNWLDLPIFNPTDWGASHDVESWWLHIVHAHPGKRKAVACLIMLVSWALWIEPNARIFIKKSSTASIMFSRIKLDARSWTIASENHMGYL
jgi:hypothetical protein